MLPALCAIVERKICFAALGAVATAQVPEYRLFNTRIRYLLSAQLFCRFDVVSQALVSRNPLSSDLVPSSLYLKHKRIRIDPQENSLRFLVAVLCRLSD